MRPDKRDNNQLRPVKFHTNYTRHAEGSVLVEFGNTWVLVTASVEEEVPPWLRDSEQGWITATYNMLPRSTNTRTRRETSGPGGRTREIQRLIGRAMRATVDLEMLRSCQITIDCDVLQADGGTRTAAITGGYVALALAWPKLVDMALAKRNGVLTPVAAVSMGLVDGDPRLDLMYDEDSKASVDFNLVMNRRGEYVELQGAGEQGGSFTRVQLNTLLDLGEKGIRELFALQEQAINGG